MATVSSCPDCVNGVTLNPFSGEPEPCQHLDDGATHEMSVPVGMILECLEEGVAEAEGRASLAPSPRTAEFERGMAAGFRVAQGMLRELAAGPTGFEGPPIREDGRPEWGENK